MKKLYSLMVILSMYSVFASAQVWYADSIVTNNTDGTSYTSKKYAYDENNNIVKEQTYSLNNGIVCLENEIDKIYTENTLIRQTTSTYNSEGTPWIKYDLYYNDNGYTSYGYEFNSETKSWGDPTSKGIYITKQLDNDTIYTFNASVSKDFGYGNECYYKIIGDTNIVIKKTECVVNTNDFSITGRYIVYYDGTANQIMLREESWKQDSITRDMTMTWYTDYEYASDNTLLHKTSKYLKDGAFVLESEEKYNDRGCLLYSYSSRVDSVGNTVPYVKIDYDYDDNGQRKFKSEYWYNVETKKFELALMGTYDNYYNSEGDLILRNVSYNRYLYYGDSYCQTENISNTYQFRYDYKYYDSGAKDITVYTRPNSNRNWRETECVECSWTPIWPVVDTKINTGKQYSNVKNQLFVQGISICYDGYNNYGEDVYLNSDYSYIDQHSPESAGSWIYEYNEKGFLSAYGFSNSWKVEYEYDEDDKVLNTTAEWFDIANGIWKENSKTSYEYLEQCRDSSSWFPNTKLKLESTISWDASTEQWIPYTKTFKCASDEITDDKRVVVYDDVFTWNATKQDYDHTSWETCYCHGVTPTSIEDINGDSDVNEVSIHDGRIQSRKLMPISVYTINGMNVFSGVASVIQLPVKGLYVVKIGNKTKTVKY